MIFGLKLSKKYCVLFFAAAKGVLKICAAGLFFWFIFMYFRTAAAENLLKALQCAALFSLSFLPRLFKLQYTLSAGFFYLFLLLAGIGGSVLGLYDRFVYYDVFTHLLSGALCVVFLADFLKTRRTVLSKGLWIGAALLFALSCAAAWEMYEFTVFTMLKNTAVCTRMLAGELGVPSAAVAAKSAIRENLALNFGTLQGLIKNEYDTFCDVLCALLGAICALPALRKARSY